MENEYVRKEAWSTLNEIKVIDYIGSDEIRIGTDKVPTPDQRKQKLMTWVVTSEKRNWNDAVDVFKCRIHAMKLYQAIEAEQ